MNALDTGLAMGASEAERIGYVLSRPEQAGRCISLIGDGTECHSGLDATRNAVYRNVPGVKVILDNSWTAMTGGQPSPTSPENMAGEKIRFDLPESLKAHGAKVVTVGAYEKKNCARRSRAALADAANGVLPPSWSGWGLHAENPSQQPACVCRPGSLQEMQRLPDLPRPRTG